MLIERWGVLGGEDVCRVWDGYRGDVVGELVLEFDGVGGVVGIRDFRGDVGDDYGEEIILGDVRNERNGMGKEESGDADGIIILQHGRFNLEFRIRGVVVKGSLAIADSRGTLKISDALCSAIQKDIFVLHKLVVNGKDDVGLLVNDVERLGKSTAMNGKGKEFSFSLQSGRDIFRRNVQGLGGAYSRGARALVDSFNGRRRFSVFHDKTIRVFLNSIVCSGDKIKKLDGRAWNEIYLCRGEEVGLQKNFGRPFNIKLGEDNNPVLLRLCCFRCRLSLDLELSDTPVELGKIILQNRAEVIEIGVIAERIESSLENYRTGTKNRNSDRLGISPYGNSLG